MLNAINCVPVITNKRKYALMRILSYVMKKYMAVYNNKNICNSIIIYPKGVNDAKYSYIISVWLWAKGDSLFTWLSDLTQLKMKKKLQVMCCNFFHLFSIEKISFCLLHKMEQGFSCSTLALQNTDILEGIRRKKPDVICNSLPLGCEENSEF